MIVFVNGATAVFGASYAGPLEIGQLLSPRCGNAVRDGIPLAVDNDAFKAWDEDRFRALLSRVPPSPWLRFVSAPDVVCDARATIHRFFDWWLELAGRGFPVAFVGQNGAEDLDLTDVWRAADAWFIGGDDVWKLSAASEDLAREAKRRGLWLHMGRVNTLSRFRAAWEIGCDSIDGTGWSTWSRSYAERGKRWQRKVAPYRTLF